MVYLKKMYEQYVDWRVLALFLRRPTTQFYVKETARVLKISPRSAREALIGLESDGILTKEVRGPLHLFKLDNDLPIAKAYKKAHALSILNDVRIVERARVNDEDLVSLALYGSYSSGEYDERSDLDILAVTPALWTAYSKLASELERDMGTQVNFKLFTLASWKMLARKKDPFYNSVVNTHTLLHGSGLA